MEVDYLRILVVVKKTLLWLRGGEEIREGGWKIKVAYEVKG